jgi:small-conductance mechanosensitive channel
MEFFKNEYIIIIIKIITIFIVGIIISKWLSKQSNKFFTKKFSPQQGLIASKLILYTGFTIISVFILREMGFKLSALFGVAGIAGIAIGFASQTSVSNIISGVFLIMEKPFKINDVITIGNTTGTVKSIDMLSVKIRTFDNKFVRIPNEQIIKTEVTNITYYPIRRIDIDVSIAYKENIEKVKQILLNLANNELLCLNEPEPFVAVTAFADSSINLSLLIWVEKNEWHKVKNIMMQKIKETFDENHIEIPFPHLSLYSGSATNPFPISINKEEKKEIL